MNKLRFLYGCVGETCYLEKKILIFKIFIMKNFNIQNCTVNTHMPTTHIQQLTFFISLPV